MSKRKGSMSLRVLYAAVAAMIAAAFLCGIGLVIQFTTNPEEIDFLKLLPWALIGAIVGLGGWHVGSYRRRGSSRRRNHSPA